MRRIGLFLLFLMHLSGAAFAFHIAGGDLTAQHISGNTFRITLTLFRDCSNPQGADFDSTIILGIYSKNNDQLIDSLHMDLTTVNSVGLSGNGCEPPPNVCMQIGEYIRDVQLPPQTGGYYLVWERCCRNSSVINIDNPDATGLTFYLEIPNPALQNSSPVFNSPPTPYTCVQQLFQFHFDVNWLPI